VRLKALELKMTTVKSLAIIALLVGGTSLAMAQSGAATGGQPPVAGGAAASGQNTKPITPSQHATKHHKKMYMSAKNTHKNNKMYMSARTHHKPLKTGQPMPKQPQ
jgi:hypothetical protein